MPNSRRPSSSLTTGAACSGWLQAWPRCRRVPASCPHAHIARRHDPPRPASLGVQPLAQHALHRQLTVDETGLTANSYVSVQVTDLDLHIGTQQFNAFSFIDVHFTTDGSGAIDLSAPLLLEQQLSLDTSPPGGGDRTLLLSQGTSLAIGWMAT